MYQYAVCFADSSSVEVGPQPCPLQGQETVRFPTARIEHGVLLLELKFRVPVTHAPAPAARANNQSQGIGLKALQSLRRVSRIRPYPVLF